MRDWVARNIGLVALGLAAVLLLAKTLPTGDPAKIAGSLVFSLSAVALYAAATIQPHGSANTSVSKGRPCPACHTALRPRDPGDLIRV